MRVAVVGIGPRGREWVQTVRATPGFALAACVDVDAGALREATAALGVPAERCHVRLEDALDAARPHALIVATPLDQHVGPCRAALGRGMAVLVEKPFTTSLRDARQLQALAAQAGVPLLVGQNYRYTRMPRAVRRLVADGVLGRIGIVDCQAFRGHQDQASRAVRTHPDGVLWGDGGSPPGRPALRAGPGSGPGHGPELLHAPVQTGVARLSGVPNVHLLGARPHARVPRYVKAFDVGVVPYRLTPYTADVYPTKLNEYLAMGIPVVATDLPAIRRFNAEHGPVAEVARDPEAFAAAIRAAALERSPAAIERRIEAARRNCWDARIAQMLALIEAGLRTRRAARAAASPGPW